MKNVNHHSADTLDIVLSPRQQLRQLRHDVERIMHRIEASAPRRAVAGGGGMTAAVNPAHSGKSPKNIVVEYSIDDQTGEPTNKVTKVYSDKGESK